MGVWKSLGGEVLEPELERVHPQLVGQVVHGRFGERAALRMPRGPHGPLAAEVGEDRRLRHGRVGHAVDVGQDHVGAAADAAGAVRLGDHGDDLAVAVGPQLDVSRAAGTIARRQVLLDAVEEHLDRPAASLLRELGRRPAPDIGAELRAEAAPHVIGVDRDVRRRNRRIERLRQVAGDAVDVLRARPGHHLVCRLPTSTVKPWGSRQTWVIIGTE